MKCLVCDADNPSNARFCNQCGTPFGEEIVHDPNKKYFGVFEPGGYGDGYCTSGFEVDIEGILDMQNSPASLSLNDIYSDHFLGEVSESELLPADLDKPIATRVKVHRWWKLNWNGEQWVLGDLLTDHPDSLGLSNLEIG